MSLVPIQLVRLLDAAGDGPPPKTLRAVLLGGGPIPATLVTRAIKAGWPVVPTYGLSEAGSGVTALPTAEAETHPTSAGRPLPGVQVRIADPDAAGVGEILVDSPARFSGYLDDPAATSAALTADGWLRTGDLGRLDLDGRLTVLDRRTDRIVRGGENISPAEIEAVLLGHPAIAEAAVVARRDPAWGHLPVAAIVLGRDSSDPGDEALGIYCRRHLAAFKVPVAFVRLDGLPKTSSGKLRRSDLRTILDPGYGAQSRRRHLLRPGGVRLAYDNFGHGPIHLLLLHGALSAAAQLGGLADALAGSGALTVHAVDRRGSGGSRLIEPVLIDVGVHVDDLVAVLDSEGCQTAVLCGVSFGGAVALEFAARIPERSLAVIAWEPPYGPVADLDTQRAFARVAVATEEAHRTGGAPAAAETFLRGVGGDVAWDRLSDRSRAFLTGEGDGAYVDAGLLGLDPIRLGRIRVPVTLLTGDASEPFYRTIADALLERVPGARHVRLPGMSHASPITDPVPMADALTSALVASGVLAPGPSRADGEEPGA
jgi:pimeloyl-ACP methyl ester carboxylesterase